MKCNCCLEEKPEYVSGFCKECADKMDAWICAEKSSKANWGKE